MKNVAPHRRSCCAIRDNRRALPSTQLDKWLGCLEGWAEVDSTCQTVFNADDLLASWDDWSALLRSLAKDANINKQRAALVLLTAPISQAEDARLLELALELIQQLQSERGQAHQQSRFLAAAQGHQAAPRCNRGVRRKPRKESARHRRPRDAPQTGDREEVARPMRIADCHIAPVAAPDPATAQCGRTARALCPAPHHRTGQR